MEQNQPLKGTITLASFVVAAAVVIVPLFNPDAQGYALALVRLALAALPCGGAS